MATTTYRNMDDVRKANADAGHYFFEPGALQFLRSRIGNTLYGGRYFITSEQFVGSDHVAAPRRYTVREVTDEGHIETVGEFQQFSTRAGAVTFIASIRCG